MGQTMRRRISKVTSSKAALPPLFSVSYQHGFTSAHSNTEPSFIHPSFSFVP